MTRSVNIVREGNAVSGGAEVISPELALVDPELAAAARFLLLEPQAERNRRSLAATRGERLNAVTAAAALMIPDELLEARVSGQRSWRLLLGVAAVAVLSLLLLDLRVQPRGDRASTDGLQAGRDRSTLPNGPPRASAEASSSQKPRQSGTQETVPRRFAWAPAANASTYHVEFFRGPTRVFARNTSRPELTMPARWRHNGKEQFLRSGEYRWYVWPVVSAKRAGSAIVQAKVVVP
jgi:hypothetical protein